MRWTPGARARVIATYEAQYADPVTFRHGEEVVVTDRVDRWRDNPDWLWIWCTDARGRSGWVPAGAIERHGATGLGLRDYSAVELSVTAGDALRQQARQRAHRLCEYCLLNEDDVG